MPLTHHRTVRSNEKVMISKIYVSPEIHQLVHISAIKEHLTITEWVARAIEHELARKK